MDMKLTVGQILSAADVLHKLELVNLPVVTAFWLNRQTEKFISPIQGFEKQREVLRAKYAPVEDDTPEKIAEKTAAFTDEIGKLVAEEVELDIEQRPASYFSKVENLNRIDVFIISFLFDKE